MKTKHRRLAPYPQEHLNKAYRKGWKSYKEGLKWTDCPYADSTEEKQAWLNGKGDASDKDFVKLIKKWPHLLIGS